MHGSKSSTPSSKILVQNSLLAVKKKNQRKIRSLGGGAGAYKALLCGMQLNEVLTPIRINNLGISGVERLRTPVTDILIFSLQHY